MIYVSIFVSSLIGGFHCFGMCGGVVTAIARDRTGLIAYHCGRIISYTALGMIAGAVGGSALDWVFTSEQQSWSFIIFGTTLAALGSLIFIGIQPHVAYLRLVPLGWAYQKVQNSLPAVRAFIIGLLTIFFPCGWLYGFVIGAIGTVSPIKGGLVMLSFAIGTIPSLTLAPILIRKLFGGIKSHRLSGAILVVSGLVLFVQGIGFLLPEMKLWP